MRWYVRRRDADNLKPGYIDSNGQIVDSVRTGVVYLYLERCVLDVISNKGVKTSRVLWCDGQINRQVSLGATVGYVTRRDSSARTER